MNKKSPVIKPGLALSLGRERLVAASVGPHSDVPGTGTNYALATAVTQTRFEAGLGRLDCGHTGYIHIDITAVNLDCQFHVRRPGATHFHIATAGTQLQTLDTAQVTTHAHVTAAGVDIDFITVGNFFHAHRTRAGIRLE